MSIRQSQTAAIRLIEVHSLNRQDEQFLRTELHLHPHDIEAWKNNDWRGGRQVYRNYVHVALPFIAPGKHRIVPFTIRAIIAPGILAVQSVPAFPHWSAWINNLLKTPAAQNVTAADFFGMLLMTLLKDLQLRWQQSDSVKINDQVIENYISSTTSLLHQLPDDMTRLNNGSPETVETYHYLAFRLKYIFEQLLTDQGAPPAALEKPTIRIPRLITGYALASTVIIVAVVISLIKL